MHAGLAGGSHAALYVRLLRGAASRMEVRPAEEVEEALAFKRLAGRSRGKQLALLQAAQKPSRGPLHEDVDLKTSDAFASSSPALEGGKAQDMLSVEEAGGLLLLATQAGCSDGPTLAALCSRLAMHAGYLSIDQAIGAASAATHARKLLLAASRASSASTSSSTTASAQALTLELPSEDSMDGSEVQQAALSTVLQSLDSAQMALVKQAGIVVSTAKAQGKTLPMGAAGTVALALLECAQPEQVSASVSDL